MALEDISRQNSGLNARAANLSASNEADQVVNDTNETIIKSAEKAAAWRTLGLTDEEGLALVARQMKINPALTEQDALRSMVQAAQDLQSEGLGLVTRDKFLNPNDVVEFGKDEADLQSLSVDEQQEGRETDIRKKANSGIAARILDAERDKRKGRMGQYFSPTRRERMWNDGTPVGQVPEIVRERRLNKNGRREGIVIPQMPEAATVSGREAGMSGGQAAMLDAFNRMDAAFSDGSLERTEENMKLYENLGRKIFPDADIRAERSEVRQLRQQLDESVNREIMARNASMQMTPQELAILERVTRGLERMGEVTVKKTGPGKDHITEIPRSMASPSDLPYATLGADGAYYDVAEGNPLARQGPERPPITAADGIGGLVYDNLYAYDQSGNYPQVGITQSVNLLQHRLGTKIPTKWGTLQGAPTTIRGIADLDQALNSVLSLAADNNKALTEMPGPDTVGQQPPVSKNPGGLEALKAIGYNRPEATSLFNAVAQLQMGSNIQVNEAQKLAHSQTGEGYYSGNVPVRFNSPEQMGDFKVDHIVGPIENAGIRRAFKNLTGDNIDIDFDDPIYSPERVLGMAQQNFGGEVLQTNDNTGVISNAKPPIGGIQGNGNYRYNKTGIRDLADLQYALEQRDLRRNAKLKRQEGDPVSRQVGTLTDRQKMNMTSGLLATERANRDERTPKALPAAGESYGSRQNAFVAEQGRRNEAIRLMKQEAARVAQGQPSGRKPLGPGEWVRASDGNVRVLGQGGIQLDRDAAIAVNNRSTSFNAASIPAEASDPWSGSASIPQTQAQPPQTPPREPRRERPRAPGGALAQISSNNGYKGGSRSGSKRKLGIASLLGTLGIGGAFGVDALVSNEQEKRAQEVYQ